MADKRVNNDESPFVDPIGGSHFTPGYKTGGTSGRNNRNCCRSGSRSHSSTFNDISKWIEGIINELVLCFVIFNWYQNHSLYSFEMVMMIMMMVFLYYVLTLLTKGGLIYYAYPSFISHRPRREVTFWIDNTKKYIGRRKPTLKLEQCP